MIAGQWGVVPSLIPPRLTVVQLDWMTSVFRRTNFPPDDLSDMISVYDNMHIYHNIAVRQEMYCAGCIHS